jgi:hypothetical protein
MIQKKNGEKEKNFPIHLLSLLSSRIKSSERASDRQIARVTPRVLSFSANTVKERERENKLFDFFFAFAASKKCRTGTFLRKE